MRFGIKQVVFFILTLFLLRISFAGESESLTKQLHSNNVPMWHFQNSLNFENN